MPALRGENTILAFRKRLIELINEYSIEKEVADTPDFLIATYLVNHLGHIQELLRRRDDWYNIHLEPGNSFFTVNVLTE
jgi:hypothetical protein